MEEMWKYLWKIQQGKRWINTQAEYYFKKERVVRRTKLYKILTTRLKICVQAIS